MNPVLLDPVTLQDTTGASVDPASEESLVLLRRLFQLLTPIGVQDVNNRQIVSIGGTSTLTTVGTVSNVASVANQVLIGGVDPRWGMLDVSHTSYSTGIRPHLTFS
jgi:hypothetical protein